MGPSLVNSLPHSLFARAPTARPRARPLQAPTDPRTVVTITPTNFQYAALFNLATDPQEHHDLSHELPDVMATLYARLTERYLIRNGPNPSNP